ncbi:MAG: MMPL family transporter [Firmicutes bacterium]|nr:MMPL family transporter [Bacillota bacterium]
MNKLHIDKIINLIVEKSKAIEKIFMVAIVLSAISYPFVNVNYDLSTYLPLSAPSKQALDIMEKEFGYPGLARIMIEDISLYEAKNIREKIAAVDQVELVIGPDTMTDVYMSNDFINFNSIDSFYKDGNAVMEVIFKGGESDKETHAALDEIYEIVGEKGHFTGSAVSKKSMQASITHEITIAIAISLAIIFLILTLTTTSWFEPVLFVSVMVIAIIINMGSNIIFGTISFFTFSTAAILQLAVSMDYSIFLLDNFTFFRSKGIEEKEAMKKALSASVSSVLASGATTIVGFVVLALMEFSIGKDIGFVLAKGIIISLATVLFLMPALILRNYKRVQKYEHKPFIPSAKGIGKITYKIRKYVLVAAILLAVPCYFGQNMNAFQYGDEAIGAGPGTLYYEDSRLIDDVFGKSNMAIGLIPNTSIVDERKLTEELNDLNFVNFAISLGSALPEGIPVDFLPKDIVEQLHTENYSRILISLNTTQESEYAFDCITKVQNVIESYYEDGYALGMTSSTMDIKDILTTDYARVSLISLLGVAIVVMLTFGSALMPVLVIIPIEVAIYLNMTIPYVIGSTMPYMGYIIVSCLQLGATIDYSILVTNNYINARKDMDKADAGKAAVSRSAVSVITSGAILTVVGYGLFFSSSVRGVSQIGRLVGRGAILSVIMVLSLLPALLIVFDKAVKKGIDRKSGKSSKKSRILKHKKKIPMPSKEETLNENI